MSSQLSLISHFSINTVCVCGVGVAAMVTCTQHSFTYIGISQKPFSHALTVSVIYLGTRVQICLLLCIYVTFKRKACINLSLILSSSLAWSLILNFLSSKSQICSDGFHKRLQEMQMQPDYELHFMKYRCAQISQRYEWVWEWYFPYLIKPMNRTDFISHGASSPACLIWNIFIIILGRGGGS